MEIATISLLLLGFFSVGMMTGGILVLRMAAYFERELDEHPAIPHELGEEKPKPRIVWNRDRR